MGNSNLYKWYKAISEREHAIFMAISIGFVYSMLLWPLLNSLCIISLFSMWLFFSNKSLPETSVKKVCLFLFPAMYLISVIGMFYTENESEGFFRLQQKLPLLIFPVVFGTTSFLNKRTANRLLLHFVTATVFACGISLAFSVYRYFLTGDLDYLSPGRLFIFKDGYPYIIGLCCLLGIVILVEKFKYATSGTPRIYFSISIVMLSVYILMLSVRVVIALWLIVLIFITFRWLRGFMLKFLVATALLLTVISCIIIIPNLRRQWNELISLKSDTIPLDRDASLGRSWGGGAIRLAIWQSTHELRTDHWLLGVGTGDIQDSLQSAYRKHKFYFASEYNKYNAHNQYLQLLISNGMAATSCLILSILMPLCFIRHFPAYRLYAVFLIAFAILCITEVFLDINKGIVWYSFFNSIFAFTSETGNSVTNLKSND